LGIHRKSKDMELKGFRLFYYHRIYLFVYIFAYLKLSIMLEFIPKSSLENLKITFKIIIRSSK
jgi:hypothetical protein